MIHSREGSFEELMADLVDEYMAATGRGETLDVDAVAKRYPEYAPQIRKTLQTLRALEELDQSELLSGDRKLDSDVSLNSIGDFQLIREIGRGGMGVVYEARQISVDRRVAVKVLPFAALADKQRLQRFKNEIRAAGALHHPHIVPLFSVGVERGVHYYAMQYIDGPSLDEVLAHCRAKAPDTVKPSTTDDDATQLHEPGSTQTPSLHSNPSLESETVREIQAAVSTKRSSSPDKYYRTVAEWGVQAASALSYAHQNGILHRDIKPGNLLLDEYGQVWVADFGLARIEQDASLTMTGDILGTLRYLAPEQALAKRVLIDHRADIYSLGASLYELLTLRPVFDAEDRDELLKRIVFESPTLPRQLDSRIPRNLETVLLKAIAKDPGDRYDTVEEFAEDLQRHLENKPIRARRASPAARIAKWAGRHTGLVAASLLIAILAAVGFAASSYQIAQERNAAQRSAQEARENYQLASEAVDQLITRVSEEKLLRAPQMEEIRKELLGDALAFYQRLVVQADDSPEAQLQMAQAEGRMADILLQLGKRQESLETSRRALDRLRPLAQEHPEEAAYAIELAKRLREHGRILEANYFIRGSDDLEVLWPTIWEAREEAITLLRGLNGRFPDRTDATLALVEAIANHQADAYEVESQYDAEKMEAALREAELLLEGLPEDSNDRDRQLLTARVLYQLGDCMNSRGDEDRMEYYADKAIEIAEELIERNADDRQARITLAQSLNVRGGSDQRKRALQLWTALAEDFPSEPRYRHQAALYGGNYALNLISNREWDAAEETILTSTDLLESLAEEFPENWNLVRGLWVNQNNLLVVYKSNGSLDRLFEAFEEAVDRQQRLAEDFGGAQFWTAGHAIVKMASIVIDSRQLTEEQFATVVERADEGRSLMSRAADTLPLESRYSLDMIRIYRPAEYLARSLFRRGRVDLARDYVQWAVDGWEALGSRSTDPYDRNHPAWLLAAWPDEEVRDPQRAIALANESLQRDKGRLGVVYAWTVLGMAHYRSQQWDECIEAMEKAIAGRVGAEHPPGGFEWLTLAVAHQHLGNEQEASRWYERGVAWYEQNDANDHDRQNKDIEAEALYEEARQIFEPDQIQGGDEPADE